MSFSVSLFKAHIISFLYNFVISSSCIRSVYLAAESHSKLYDEESLLSLTMSQDGFPNEDGEQMTPELLLLQERQRASEWPKVRASFLDMESLERQCNTRNRWFWFSLIMLSVNTFFHETLPS